MENNYFEKIAAVYIKKTASLIPKELLSVVFSSPLSARSPDLCMLWHTGYRQKHRYKLLAKSLLLALVEGMKCCVRIIKPSRSFYYAVYGESRETLLVFPSACGSMTSQGGYRTPYVNTSEKDCVFVFGKESDLHEDRRREMAVPLKLKLNAFSLFFSGILAFVGIKGKWFDKLLLLLEWLVWVFQIQWIYDFLSEQALEEVVRERKISQIACIHEMHAYARIIWRVAEKMKLCSYTLQHAEVTYGKRWYFCYPEEIEAGLALPQVMYIYNREIEAMLRPYYPDTKFVLGCSPRYAHWKNTPPTTEKGEYILFVGALARFDNDVLLNSLQILLAQSKEEMRIKVRLHPFADLTPSMRKWLDLVQRESQIELSRDISLNEDLKHATVVVGMSTTVLEEALLLGKPIVQLEASEYLEFIELNEIDGALKKKYDQLTRTDLDTILNAKVDSQEMRMRLGLENDVVDYKKLFLNTTVLVNLAIK